MLNCVLTIETAMADCEGGDLDHGLADLLEAYPTGPVTLLLHGYRYCPFHAPTALDPVLRDPRKLLYAATPAQTCDRVTSWTSGLDLPGAVIGVAWPAMPSDAGLATGLREFASIYARAERIGRQLAILLDRIAGLAPGRRINLIGHSLGGRVALSALPHLMRSEPARVLLWGAAERCETALRAIADGPASTEIVNVTARANLPYDRAFRALAPGQGPTLGSGLKGRGTVNLRLDDAVSEAALAKLGHRLGPLRARRCHWLYYTREGVMPLYRDLLLRPSHWSLERIGSLAERPARGRFALPDPAHLFGFRRA